MQANGKALFPERSLGRGRKTAHPYFSSWRSKPEGRLPLGRTFVRSRALGCDTSSRKIWSRKHYKYDGFGSFLGAFHRRVGRSLHYRNPSTLRSLARCPGQALTCCHIAIHLLRLSRPTSLDHVHLWRLNLTLDPDGFAQGEDEDHHHFPPSLRPCQDAAERLFRARARTTNSGPAGDYICPPRMVRLASGFLRPRGRRRRRYDAPSLLPPTPHGRPAACRLGSPGSSLSFLSVGWWGCKRKKLCRPS
ncbi:hypothetical protein GW17_00009607 [Ensete ventricosum]|nr:hypothetical protein GW17_00009607 [Ensete ventricosum]RZS08548.1 hypothetical protein BHM03_00039544 [Ensete ventricosum]